MALRGMPSNLADSGVCTKTAPAFSLMARRPSVPSEPIPERMTPMLCSSWSSASERKKKSIGRRSPRGAAGSSRCSTPCRMDRSRGRNYIDMARFDLHPVLDLDNWHGGASLEQLHQQPLAGQVQVLDDHEGQPTGGRHMAQEEFQRLQSPGGSADADDGKSVMGVGRDVRGGRGAGFCFGEAGGR